MDEAPSVMVRGALYSSVSSMVTVMFTGWGLLPGLMV